MIIVYLGEYMTNICAVRLVLLVFQLPTQSLRFNIGMEFLVKAFLPQIYREL